MGRGERARFGGRLDVVLQHAHADRAALADRHDGQVATTPPPSVHDRVRRAARHFAPHLHAADRPAKREHATHTEPPKTLGDHAGAGRERHLVAEARQALGEHQQVGRPPRDPAVSVAEEHAHGGALAGCAGIAGAAGTLA